MADKCNYTLEKFSDFVHVIGGRDYETHELRVLQTDPEGALRLSSETIIGITGTVTIANFPPTPVDPTILSTTVTVTTVLYATVIPAPGVGHQIFITSITLTNQAASTMIQVSLLKNNTLWRYLKVTGNACLTVPCSGPIGLGVNIPLNAGLSVNNANGVAVYVEYYIV
jgi:hypothetical protein